MAFVPNFVLSILGATEGHNPPRMCLIVRRQYSHLEPRLRRAFEGRADVEVIADRRWRERRVGAQTVGEERRQGDRRAPKDEILEIVIEGDPLALFPPTSPT